MDELLLQSIDDPMMKWADDLPDNDTGVRGWTTAGVFVPECCFDCHYHDGGETGDYGTVHSSPYCLVGVKFPTRKGSCKRHKKAISN